MKYHLSQAFRLSRDLVLLTGGVLNILGWLPLFRQQGGGRLTWIDERPAQSIPQERSVRGQGGCVQISIKHVLGQ